MKKLLCIAFASAMLSAGYAQAADLPLADGHVLPLDASISVHQGKDSYYGQNFNQLISSPEIEKKMVEAMKKNKNFSTLSETDKETMAKEAVRLLKDTQIGQIVSDTGDHVYQAFVLSCPMTKDSFASWETISTHLPTKDTATPFDGISTWEEYQAMLSSGITSQETQYDAAISLGDGLGEVIMNHTQWEQNRSRRGVPYMHYSLTSTQKMNRMLTPLYLSVLVTPGQDKLCFTLIATSSTDGLYFQPYIDKALEALQ